MHTEHSFTLDLSRPMKGMPATFWFRRATDLENLGLFDTRMIDDRSRSGVVKIVRVLERARAAECARGKGGHWAYDHGLFRALCSALSNERKLLANAEFQ